MKIGEVEGLRYVKDGMTSHYLQKIWEKDLKAVLLIG